MALRASTWRLEAGIRRTSALKSPPRRQSLPAALRTARAIELCRSTRMKLRAKKGAGAVSLDELAGFPMASFASAAPTLRAPRHLPRPPLRRDPAPLSTRVGEPTIRSCSTQRASLRSAPSPPTGADYATAAQRELLDVLPSIRHKVTVETAGRCSLANAERPHQPAAEMRALRRSAEAIVTPVSCRTPRNSRSPTRLMNSRSTRWVPAKP